MPIVPPEHFSDIEDLQKEFSRAKAAERELEVIRALVADPLAFEAALRVKIKAEQRARTCRTCKLWRRLDAPRGLHRHFLGHCDSNHAGSFSGVCREPTSEDFGCIFHEEKTDE